MADVMTDDELLEMMGEDTTPNGQSDDDLLALMGDDEDSPPVSAAPEEDATLAQGLTHALKGYGKMGVGIADMPNMISGIGTWPVRKLLNSLGVDEKYTDRAVIPSLSEQPGMDKVAQWLDKTEGVEEGSGWDMAQTGVEWGGMGPVSAARKGASALPDALMAAGATAGEYLGDDYGELAGGLGGLLLSLKRGKGVDDALGAIQDSITTSADDVAANVRAGIASDEVGTLADLARDQGVMDVEALTSGGKNTEKYRTREFGRQQQIADEVRSPFGTADPNLARNAGQARIDNIVDDIIPQHTKTRQRQVEIPLRAEQAAAEAANEIPQAAAVEAGLNKARAQERAGVAMGNTVEAAKEAEAARAAFSTGDTLAESSIKGSAAWKAEKAADKAKKVQPKWDEFDAVKSTDYAPYKATVDGFVDGLPDSQKIEFNDVFSSLMRPFRNEKTTEMKPKQIQKFLEQIKKELGKPRGGVRAAAHDDLQTLYTELRTQLADDVPIFDEAMQAEAAWKTRFDAGGAIDEASKLEPEFFFNAAGESDEAGAVAARIINDADIPGMPEAQAGRLRALARRFKDGTPDDKFLLEYESIMDSLPQDIRSQAQAVIDTGRGLETAGAAQTAADDLAKVAGKQAAATTTAADASAKATAGEVSRLEKAIAAQQGQASSRGARLERSVNKSNINKYVKDRKGTLLKMLKNPDDVSDLVELKRSMERLGETDSFNANLGDVILERLSVKGRTAGLAEATGRGPALTTAAIPEFNKISASLVEAGYDPKTMQAIKDKLYKLQTAEQRAVSRKAIMESDSMLKDIIVSGSKATALKAIPGNSLVMAGTVGRVMRSLLTKAGSSNKAMLAAIDDFMLNPAKYLEALEAAKTPAQVQQILMSELVAASNVSSTLNQD